LIAGNEKEVAELEKEIEKLQSIEQTSGRFGRRAEIAGLCGG